MNLVELAEGLLSQGLSKDSITAALKEATGPEPIRNLSEQDRLVYGGAVAKAALMMPAFRDGLGMLRPFRDYTTPTLYVDKHSRVGIGAAFFDEKKSPAERATELLHETMHVLSHHFTRESGHGLDSNWENIAKDMEINTTLEKHPKTVMDFFVFPDKNPYNFPPMKSYEQYAALISSKFPQSKDQNSGSGDPQQGNGSDSQDDQQDSQSGSGEGDSSDSQDGGSGDSIQDAIDQAEKNQSNSQASSNGKAQPGQSSPQPGKSNCDASSDEREKGADKIDVEPASPSEQALVRKNVSVRVQEEMQKAQAAGQGSLLQMFQKMDFAFRPAKVDWRTIFRRIVSSSSDAITLGRSDYSYRRVNKRLSQGEYIFPGMVTYRPKAMLAVDTSGSMAQGDFVSLLSEVEGLVKRVFRGKESFSAFCVDTKVTEPKAVNSIKSLDLAGGGGTAMEAAVYSVDKINVKKQPDILIIATDGGTSWPALKKAIQEKKGKFRVLILVSRPHDAKEGKKVLSGVADVVDVSD